MKPFGYNRVIGPDGKINYIRKIPDRVNSRLDRTNPDNASAIRELKFGLESKTSELNRMIAGISDPGTVPLKHGAAAYMKHDITKLNNDIKKIVSDLSYYGIRVIMDSIKTGKIVYKEQGGIDMYSVSELKQMKLEVFEEKAAGNISDGVSNYLIPYFDAMIEKVECSERTRDKKKKRLEQVVESALETDTISENDKSVLLAAIDVVLESDDGDDDDDEEKNTDTTDLVEEFLTACREKDDDKRKELEKILAGKSKSSDFEKELEKLKEGLTDNEKKFVEELDESIRSGKKIDSKTESVSNDSSEKDFENLEKSLEGNSKLKVSKKTETNASDTDDNTGFRALTESGLDTILGYLTESVGSGNISAEDANALADIVSM